MSPPTRACSASVGIESTWVSESDTYVSTPRIDEVHEKGVLRPEVVCDHQQRLTQMRMLRLIRAFRWTGLAQANTPLIGRAGLSRAKAPIAILAQVPGHAQVLDTVCPAASSLSASVASEILRRAVIPPVPPVPPALSARENSCAVCRCVVRLGLDVRSGGGGQRRCGAQSR